MSCLGASAVTRGRDPWVFRLILENKNRMLVAGLRTDLWVAYNPANGGIYKVWNNGVLFRGKVFDFSQNSSLTQGTVHHTQKNTILNASTESLIPAGWTASGVTTGTNDWTFASGATLTSPVFDLTGYSNVMLTFYEQVTGSFNVEISNDGGATWTAQTFQSTKPGGNALQENLKQIVVTGSNVRIRFVGPSQTSSKTLRDIVLIGDYAVWSATQGGSPVATSVDWRGYRTANKTESLHVKYDIVFPGNVRATVEENPEQLVGRAIARNFNLSGLPSGAVASLKINGVSGLGQAEIFSVSGSGSLRTADGNTYLDLASNGVTTLNTTWTP